MKQVCLCQTIMVSQLVFCPEHQVSSKVEIAASRCKLVLIEGHLRS